MGNTCSVNPSTLSSPRGQLRIPGCGCSNGLASGLNIEQLVLEDFCSAQYDAEGRRLMAMTTDGKLPRATDEDGEPMAFRQPLLNDSEKNMIKDLPIVEPSELPDATLTVELRKIEATQRIGIRTYRCRGSHCIMHIYPGSMVDNWNRKNPGNEIQHGDHIVDVNGLNNDENLIWKAWTTTAEICLKIIAASVFQIVIEKGAGEMLGIMTKSRVKVHQISSIMPGGVIDNHQRNAKGGESGFQDEDESMKKVETVRVHGKSPFSGTSSKMPRPARPPTKQAAKNQVAKVGDYIVEVNGLRGNAEFIRQIWISSDKVVLVVVSPRIRWGTGVDEDTWSFSEGEAQHG